MITEFIKVSFLLFGVTVLAQPATEVYLMDLTVSEEKISVGNFENISQNPGYDNQPSFDGENRLLYASTRDGQTDILQYNLEDRSKKWFNKTTSGGEYSPT
ncbi:MAG: steroid delta-isomerase, partial [Bacteroidota bacterium]